MRGRKTRALVLAAGSALLAGALVGLWPSSPAIGQDRPTEAGGRAEAEILQDAAGQDDLDQDVSSDVRSERGGEKVKVFRFSGLDVAGRTKSPQLLYFLNRLRAEFDRPRLPHRSFIPELQRSTKTGAF